jgi:hypothetical protein
MELPPDLNTAWISAASEKNEAFLLENGMNSAVAYMPSRMPLSKPLTTEWRFEEPPFIAPTIPVSSVQR